MAQHVVRPGECIHELAARYGVTAEDLLADNPGLREGRADPYVILPGDLLDVPNREAPRHAISAGGAHRFSAAVPTHRLRVTVRSDDGVRANATYRLEIDGRQPVEGTTDGDGVAELTVPSTARGGVLCFDADPPLRIALRFGHLNPVDDATGIQQRLRNLGYDCGAIDGRVGPHTAAALRAFQTAAGLEATGEIDERTRDELRRQHGS